MTDERADTGADLPEIGFGLDGTDPASLFGEQPLVRPDMVGSAAAASSAASAAAASSTASASMATVSSAALIESAPGGGSGSGLADPFPAFGDDRPTTEDTPDPAGDDLFGPAGGSDDTGGLGDLFGDTPFGSADEEPVDPAVDLFGPTPDAPAEPFAPAGPADPAGTDIGDGTTADPDNAPDPGTESIGDHSIDPGLPQESVPAEQSAIDSSTEGSTDSEGADSGADTDITPAG